MSRKKIKKILHSEKIAAGEVVERPANIVKELVENGIDAGATEIRIILKKAGKNLIQVIDNGTGIPAEEIEFAFERHTSSKIRSIEDLDRLNTLGFRGEALASIAAVSKVEITSKTADEVMGVNLILDGGKIIEKREISCPTGTNIKVNNLFYNLPARQKFLKSDNTELGHVTNFIQRFALANHRCHFIYRHNEVDIINSPASSDLKTTVFHIYGKKMAKLMEEINFNDGTSQFRVHGLLGNPSLAKKSRSRASLFLNGRYILSDLLYDALKEAYKGTLMIGRAPFFVLFLELNPSNVDFNVHPKKLEVRFENEEFVYNRTYNVIRRYIEEFFIEKESKYLTTELPSFTGQEQETIISEEDFPMDIEEIIEEEFKEQETKIQAKIAKIQEPVQLKLDDPYKNRENKPSESSDAFRRGKYIISKNFPKLRLLSETGQLSNKTYIVLEGMNDEGEEGIYILDQHAASERINMEYFLDLEKSSKRYRQQLITPLNVEVGPDERFFLEDHLEELKSLGFLLEHFGGNTFILREMPTIFGRLPDIEVLRDIISDVIDLGKEKSFSKVKEEIINYLSCHHSIRGGDDLNVKDIKKLLEDLANCKDSFHCAHGRPTLKFISYKELDKLFKRTG